MNDLQRRKMKTRIYRLITIFFLASISSLTFAQDLKTKVEDALSQMPTQDLAYRDRLLSDLLHLGPNGIDHITQLLIPAGEGDDTSVRFAINSLARYASVFGKENARAMVETGLLTALEKQTDDEVRTFILHQLNLIGTDATVHGIKKYLADEILIEPVVQTLLYIGTDSAAGVLFEYVNKSSEEGKIILIKALGALRFEKALEPITSFASSENTHLRKVSLGALANIGSPQSYRVLLKAAKDVNFRYEPTQATDAFLVYAGRLAEDGQTNLSKKALKATMKASQTDDRLHIYAAALSLYNTHFGYEVMPFLLKAVESQNKEFRTSVLKVAQGVGDVAATRLWIEKATEASGDKKAEIIYMLGKRGDKLAASYVASSMNDQSPIVREEAIYAYSRLQGKEAVPALLEHLEEGKDIDAVKTALIQFVSQKHLGPVAAKLSTTSGETKAALIELIAATSGNLYFEEIIALTASENLVEKESAFKALKHISQEKHLDALIQLLLNVEEEREIVHLQEAIVAASKAVKTEKTEAGKLLGALKTASKKERILAILPEIGGPLALQTVSYYFENYSGKLKDVAFNALINWKEYDVTSSLYRVIANATEEYRFSAFSSFVRHVRTADIPDDQKLLQYRKIMPYANGPEDQTLVINAIGGLSSFLSLVYLTPYLDDNNLQQPTADAIMRIALSDSNHNKGLAGQYLRDLLQRVASVLTGEEKDYHAARIKKYLTQMPKDKGFSPMFNGKNLDGWQGMLLDGNPIKIAKLSESERKKAQEEANREMLKNWSVKDGQIIFNGHGANLVSTKKYRDFEMIVDWKITRKGDSGIYLRGTPQVQIWDTSLVEVGAQVGSGGLYNNNTDNIRDPLKVADNPVGDWNTFRIIMVGEFVTVYLNGQRVVDNVRMDNFWDRNIPIFEEGTIELQAHGNELAFRDIYVKEINTAEIGLTEEEKADGFKSLFNGINLDGWQGNKIGYFAENGELVALPKNGGVGNLFTNDEYSDFIIRFDFQLTHGANNGLGIRSPLKGDPAYYGMELQILDDTSPLYAHLKDYQYHGSVYGAIPSKRGYLNPVGTWNQQEVVVKGPKIKITLNGTVILDGDIAEARKKLEQEGGDIPGLKREKGYIGFLGHGSELKFRNIRIKDISL